MGGALVARGPGFPSVASRRRLFPARLRSADHGGCEDRGPRPGRAMRLEEGRPSSEHARYFLVMLGTLEAEWTLKASQAAVFCSAP
jgi:hypothetical protein